MNKVILVGLGGLVGSVLRYWLGGYVQQTSRSVQFSYGTLAVNLIGCLVIGFLAQLAEVQGALSPEARLFLMVGLLGGFTTFSTFGNETLNLFRGGESFVAFANISLHVVAGLGAVWLGRTLAHLIWR
jgi:fluoride exporter